MIPRLISLVPPAIVDATAPRYARTYFPFAGA
jgi:hypothetical protein